jgi:hypothetical protein
MIKISEIEQEHKNGKVSKATMIKMAAFRAELEKSAFNFGSTARVLLPKMQEGAAWAAGGVATTAALGGIGALIHFGIQELEGAWEQHKLDSNMEPMFQKVILEHPELGEDEKKQNLARKYFDALYHFSPAMAENPLTAGAYIKQALQMHHVAGGPLPEMVEKATQIQKNLSDARDKDKSEYVTPLGAIFLPFKPKSGGIMPNISIAPSGKASDNPAQLNLGL